MAYDDRYLAGIGGWLAFFWISITILAPLSILVSVVGQFGGNSQLAAVYGSAWPMVRTGEFAIGAASIAGLWFMSWRLMKVETWQTVRIVIAGLWIVGLGGPLLEALLIASTGIADPGNLGEIVGAEIVRPLIADSLWTAYFLRSRRVANTYPRDDAHQDVGEIFS